MRGEQRKIPISSSVGGDLYKQLEQAAYDTHLSKSEFIREAIIFYINNLNERKK